MPPRRLVHHLRSYRKTFGLSQREVGRLLGSGQGSSVCRYERFQTMPSLRTAIAYEVIFKASLSDILPDLYAEVKDAIGRRARTLLKKNVIGPPKSRARKWAFLQSLIRASTDNSHST